MPALWILPVGLLCFLIVRIVYRLYFHPLSSIPGPRLAAATSLYEFYYNVVHTGLFLFEIKKMHQKYGPIVRITPREIHVADPSFYDEIYASSRRRREKDPQNVRLFGIPDSMVATVDHDLHRFRRSILEDFFSKRSVLSLSSLVNERLSALMKRLDSARLANAPICLDDAFTALTSDIITAMTCGRHWGFLEDKDFRNDIRRAVDDTVRFSHINRFVPWLVYVPQLFPAWMVKMLWPGKVALYEFVAAFKNQAVATFQQSQMAPKSKARSTSEGPSRTMMMALADPSIPPKERDHNRVQSEAFSVLTAGSEATAHILTVGMYHFARDPVLRQRLRAELKQVFEKTDTPNWTELEALPYLNGFVNESLRLSYAASGRLPRIAPNEALRYGDYVIPRGTPVSTISYLVHRNPTIFPDPLRFEPERWIKAADRGEYLKRYLVIFTKGSRGCIGLNLAYMEIFLTIAHVVQRFDVELHDTEEDDVKFVRDLNIGYTKRGPMKVHAKMTLAGSG